MAFSTSYYPWGTSATGSMEYQMRTRVQYESEKMAREMADKMVQRKLEMIHGGTFAYSERGGAEKAEKRIKELESKLEEKKVVEKNSLESLIAYYYNR